MLERLNGLHSEYDEITVYMAHPFYLTDFEMLKQRRQAVLHEARKLAGMLSMSEPSGSLSAIRFLGRHMPFGYGTRLTRGY
jgi:hypothetical protein